MNQDLFTFEEAMNSPNDGALSMLADWMARNPMSAHPDLGRPGAVCPFVWQASRFNTLRLGVSLAGPDSEEAVFGVLRSSFARLSRIPAPKDRQRLRTIIIGFPRCANREGLAMVGRVYRRHKYYSLLRFRMVAYFHPASEDGGLWNPDFRPMRAPMPVLGVRYLTEHDAVFALKHHLMMGPYLLRFGPAGMRKLLAQRQNAGSVRRRN